MNEKSNQGTEVWVLAESGGGYYARNRGGWNWMVVKYVRDATHFETEAEAEKVAREVLLEDVREFEVFSYMRF